MGIRTEKSLSRKRETLQMDLMAYSVSSPGIDDSFPVCNSSQILMIIEILESDLDCIVIDIAYRKLITDFIESERFEFKVCHCTGGILCKRLIDSYLYAFAFLKPSLNKVGREYFIAKCLTHAPDYRHIEDNRPLDGENLQ